MLRKEAKALQEFIADYRINLVAPAQMDDDEFKKFETGLGNVLKYIKHSQNKQELTTIVNEDKAYRNLDEASARLINTITGSNLQIVAKEGKVDMCKAIEEMRRDSKEEGKREGRRELLSALVSKGLLCPEEASRWMYGNPTMLDGTQNANTK